MIHESVHQAIQDPAAAQTGARELARVDDAVRAWVIAFCHQHLFDSFRMGQLTAFVQVRTRCAPDSPGRILRHLRKSGAVRYELISRRESMYVITAIEEEA
jgi:hypothetical protein